VSQGQIFTNFTQLNTIFGNNHVEFDAGTDNGKHNFCQFVEQGASPATAVNELAIYTLDTGSQPDFFFREESSGVESRLTGGGISAAAYCTFTGTTGALDANSYNVASITRVGAGDYQVNFTRNFDSANYTAMVSINIAGALLPLVVVDKSKAAGTFSFGVKNSTTTLATDPASIDLVFYGLLA